jgi:hypothetical protein
MDYRQGGDIMARDWNKVLNGANNNASNDVFENDTSQQTASTAKPIRNWDVVSGKYAEDQENAKRAATFIQKQNSYADRFANIPGIKTQNNQPDNTKVDIQSEFKRLFPSKTVTADQVKAIGEIPANAQIEGTTKITPLKDVKISGPMSFATGVADAASMGLLGAEARRLQQQPKGLPQVNIYPEKNNLNFIEEAQKQNPVSFGVGKVVGSVPTLMIGAPEVGIEAAASKLPWVAQKALSGGIVGGAQGLLENSINSIGNNRTAGEKAQDIIKGTAEGAGLGAITNVGLGALGKLAGKIFPKIKGEINGTVPESANTIVNKAPDKHIGDEVISPNINKLDAVPSNYGRGLELTSKDFQSLVKPKTFELKKMYPTKYSSIQKTTNILEDVKPPETAVNIETPKKTVKGISILERKLNTVGKDALISKKNVDSYMFDNPEVKPFFQEYAQYILENEFVPNEKLHRQTQVMKMLKNDTGLSPKDIKNGLERLVANNGQENVAVAKRIELAIDDMLTNGFESVSSGDIPPIKNYIDIKNKLEGTTFTAEPKLENDLPIPGIDKNIAIPVNNANKNIPKLEDTFLYSPNKKDINAKVWYHGSGTTGLTADTLTPHSTKIEGLYGQGVYLTDDKEIASQYAKARSKRTGTPVVYEANINLRNAIDLEKPLPLDAYNIIKNEVSSFDNNFGNGNFSNELDKAYLEGKSGKEIWEMATNEMADISQSEMIPKSELYDYFQDITANLKENGYDGFTHIGGVKTNGKKHQVAVLFDPNSEFTSTVYNKNILNFKPTEQAVNELESNMLNRAVSKSATQPNTNTPALESKYILPNDVKALQTMVDSMKKREEQGLDLNFQLFGEAQKKLNKLLGEQSYTTASELPKEANKVVLEKAKEPSTLKNTFENAWNKFYTNIVDTQHPISKFSKEVGDKTATLASNSRNVSGVVDHNILDALVDSKGNKVGDSLKSVIEKIPKGQEEDFWNYMSHLHNIDRAKENKNVISNYTSEMSDLKVKDIEKLHPEYKTAAQGVTNWIDKFMRTWGVKTGIVDEINYEVLRDKYKNYFPTQREFSQLENSIPEGVSKKFVDMRSPIKKATGSERDIKDPVENIMNLVNRTVRTAKYNEVGQSLVNSLRKNPEELAKYAEILESKPVRMTDNISTVIEDGKPVYIKFNNKALMDSFNGLPKIINSPKALNALTGLYKGLITQKNPIFAVRNIFRDIPTAYVFGSESNPLKFAGNLGKAVKEITTNGESLQRYKALGGGGANFFNSGNANKAALELMDKKTALQNGLNIAKKPIDWIEKFNNITETAPRLAEFNTVLERTGDVDKAMAAANDVTVNFSRGGYVTKYADKGVPYLNAGVQGLDKFFRSFVTPQKAASTLIKAGIAVSTPEIALYLINRDNPNFKRLDNRTKDNYFVIPNGIGETDKDGNATTFIKIPKSRELGILFGSLLSRVGRAASGEENAFKNFGGSVATNFSPTNPIENNILAPATYNLKANKDFAGRDIVPQYMLEDNRSAYLQYDDKTSEIAKKLGELSHTATRGSGLSPKQIDYLAKSYFGVLSQLGLPATTKGNGPGKAITNQFTANPLYSSQVVTDFYDKKNKLMQGAADKNIIENIPSKQLTEEEIRQNAMNNISKSIAQGNKKIMQLTVTGNSGDEIKQIKQSILQAMDKANNAKTIEDYKKAEFEAKRLFPKIK